MSDLIFTWLAVSAMFGFLCALFTGLTLDIERRRNPRRQARGTAILTVTCWLWPLYLLLVVVYALTNLTTLALGVDNPLERYKKMIANV